MFGNYTAQGGVGVFVDTLQTYSYFVIPETYYGHIFFFNQDGSGFLDKTVTSKLTALNLGEPLLVARTSNDNLLVCTNNLSGSLYKMDHAGNLLARNSKTVVLSSNETPISLLCDYNDNVTLVTTKKQYVFDSLFNLKTSTNNTIPISSATAFSYDVTTGGLTAVTVPNVLDVQFDGLSAWSINTAGSLCLNSIPLNTNTQLPNLTGTGLIPKALSATNVQIDPYGNIWVLAGTNVVYVYNPITPDSSYYFNVGGDYSHPQKHLSFINVYDRTTSTFELSLIHI